MRMVLCWWFIGNRQPGCTNDGEIARKTQWLNSFSCTLISYIDSEPVKSGCTYGYGYTVIIIIVIIVAIVVDPLLHFTFRTLLLFCLLKICADPCTVYVSFVMFSPHKWVTMPLFHFSTSKYSNTFFCCINWQNSFELQFY